MRTTSKFILNLYIYSAFYYNVTSTSTTKLKCFIFLRKATTDQQSPTTLTFAHLLYNHASGYYFESKIIDYSLTSLTRVKKESTKEDCGIWIDSHYDLMTSLFGHLATNHSQVWHYVSSVYSFNIVWRPKWKRMNRTGANSIGELKSKLGTINVPLWNDQGVPLRFKK